MRPGGARDRHRRQESVRDIEFGRRYAEVRTDKGTQDQNQENRQSESEFGSAPSQQKHIGAEPQPLLADRLFHGQGEFARHQYCNLLSIFVAAKSTRMLTQTRATLAKMAIA